MNIFFSALEAQGEPSLISELWQSFYDTYINPSEHYENLNLESNGLISIQLVILGLFLGLIIAGFSAVFTKRVLGDVVRRVLKCEAFSPESAKTLEEMGLEGSFIARNSVCKSVSVRRVLKCVEEENFYAEQAALREEYEKRRENGEKLPRFKDTEYKVNPYADRFYIPEKIRYMADVKFEKKGSTWAGAISLLIIMVVAFIAIMIGLPYILSFLDDLLGAIKS